MSLVRFQSSFSQRDTSRESYIRKGRRLSLFLAGSATPQASVEECLPSCSSRYHPRFAASPTYGLPPFLKYDYSCHAGSHGFLSTPSDLVRFGMSNWRRITGRTERLRPSNRSWAFTFSPETCSRRHPIEVGARATIGDTKDGRCQSVNNGLRAVLFGSAHPDGRWMCK